MKCWKITDEADAAGQAVIRVGTSTYALQDATEEEIWTGKIWQAVWCVEREYMVQVCGPDAPRGYWDRRSETERISFDELIFCGGECIGIYHNECTMLFDDENTHSQKKWLGEVITGPERSIDVYDYYNLKRSKLQ